MTEIKSAEEIARYILDGMDGIGGVPSNEEFYNEFNFRLRLALDIKPKPSLTIEQENLSGLSTHELEIENIMDKIKQEKSTLKCIGLMRNLERLMAKNTGNTPVTISTSTHQTISLPMTIEEAKGADEILSKHLKECFEIHGEKLSDKYHGYLLRAMTAYANSLRQIVFPSENNKVKFLNDSGIASKGNLAVKFFNSGFKFAIEQIKKLNQP